MLDALREFSLREGVGEFRSANRGGLSAGIPRQHQAQRTFNELDLIARFKIDVLLRTRQLAFLLRMPGWLRN